jgi:hypothetical protein
VEWMNLVWDKNKWRAVVNPAVNLRFQQSSGNFTESLLDSYEGLCSLELVS